MSATFFCACGTDDVAVNDSLAAGAVPGAVYGLLPDSRDGQVYSTVEIGDQTWMAENLNYDALNGSGSRCYDDESKYCKEYGRLYDWETALNACPEGWHLPSNAEWASLAAFLGGAESAGAKLKASVGWANQGYGADSFGFSALPGGYFDGEDFVSVKYGGYWWTDTEVDSTEAMTRFLYYPSAKLFRDWNGKDNAYSIRCLKNEEE